MQKEVDEVIGRDRNPRLSDRSKCPLLEAVVMETLRYISHVPVFVLHSTSQSTTIGGYKVEKDTVVGYCKDIENTKVDKMNIGYRLIMQKYMHSS